MMAGVMESAELRKEDDNQDDNLMAVLGGAYGGIKHNRSSNYEDPLGECGNIPTFSNIR